MDPCEIDIESTCSEKSSLRRKADRARNFRLRSVVCVLEHPKNVANVASVIRNIDALGVTKLYIVDGALANKLHSKRSQAILNACSASASKYVYVRHFSTSDECFDYLALKNYVSYVTSPHVKTQRNFTLDEFDCTTDRRIAIWFGNESRGISDRAVERSSGCIQIEMCGIIESLNLAVSTGIVLNAIVSRRRRSRRQ